MLIEKKVHLKDIAREAGVSTALVSYVLNGRNTNRINPETAERVKLIARKLNYTPDFLGKALKSKRTQTIGLIIPDLTHPFFINLAHYLENELVQHNYLVIIASSDEDPKKQRSIIETFIQRKVDGLIVLPLINSEDDILTLHENGVPYVLTDRIFPDYPFNYVTTDNYYGTFAITQKLIEAGKTRLALITLSSTMHHFEMRKLGFKEACGQSSFKIQNTVIEFEASSTYEQFDNELSQMIQGENNIDGLVCATDYLTMNVVKFILKHRFEVPQDVEIASFDYVPGFSVFPFPITYHVQPLHSIGQKLVSYLMGRIDNKDSRSIQRLTKGSVSNTFSEHSAAKLQLINLQSITKT